MWDYPRPPRVEARSERIVVRLGGTVIVDTTDAVRVLETSHPPVYYLPIAAFAPGTLVPTAGSSWCEFKGEANYFDVRAGGAATGRAATGGGTGAAAVVPDRAAWTYPRPTPGFEVLEGRVALYPSRMDSCEVDGERIVPQEGDFYGGWATANIVGPFKGGPGTSGW